MPDTICYTSPKFNLYTFTINKIIFRVIRRGFHDRKNICQKLPVLRETIRRYKRFPHFHIFGIVMPRKRYIKDFVKQRRIIIQTLIRQTRHIRKHLYAYFFIRHFFGINFILYICNLSL